MSDSPDEIPTFDELAADPEIAALLDFEPVPRERVVKGGWSPERQREFIARLAVSGSPGRACNEMGTGRSSIDKLYPHPLAASFRASWHAAIELAMARRAAAVPDGPAPMLKAPAIDLRRKTHPHPDPSSAHLSPGQAARFSPRAREGGEGQGQILNEFGKWEDEDSYRQRGEDLREGIVDKLRRCRRLYLKEISASAGKRAAFEILTDLPVDWDKAERLEPQPDEPWRRVSMREPDILLTAENGWMAQFVGGPDKIAARKREVRKEMDSYHAEHGLPPIDWEAEGWEEK